VVNNANGTFSGSLTGWDRLMMGRDYWVRVRHIDDKGGESAWSEVSGFTTEVVDMATVQLQWSPNLEMDLAGYRVYYGPDTAMYSSSVDVGNRTSCTISDEGFQEGCTYYFAVTAYDVCGNESAFSDEVSYTFPPAHMEGDDPDPDKVDTDGDGLDNDSDTDDDNDGLLDAVETNTGVYENETNTGTDPLIADTDGDGVHDGAEIAQGTDPNNDQEFPKASPRARSITAPILFLLGP